MKAASKHLGDTVLHGSLPEIMLSAFYEGKDNRGAEQNWLADKPFSYS